MLLPCGLLCLEQQPLIPITLRLPGRSVQQTESGWYGKEALPWAGRVEATEAAVEFVVLD